MRECLFQTKLENGKVRCGLCPRRCEIEPGKSGYCMVRRNRNGVLEALSYGHPVAVQNDPIEKKPLAWFLPGTRTLSFGTFGCNFGCVFCQNHELSRGEFNPGTLMDFVTPAEIADAAVRQGCASVAFTYNEPVVFYEYMMDTADEAHKRGLKTVMVSNGFLLPEPAEKLFPRIDAANFDMKGFSEEFYRSMCGGASLAPVLNTFRIFRRAGGHAEFTTLVIPGKNDSNPMIEGWFDWVEKNLGLDTPLHFTAYHPDYLYSESPPTPPEELYRIRDRALERGFSRVRLGNIR